MGGDAGEARTREGGAPCQRTGTAALESSALDSATAPARAGGAVRLRARSHRDVPSTALNRAQS